MAATVDTALAEMDFMHRAVSSHFSAPRGRYSFPLAALAAVATLALSGCGAVRTIAGVNTVRLHDARVEAMEVEIGNGARTICPRQPMQMHVAVSAQLPGRTAPATYDTWRGVPGIRHNGKLDFADFAFASDQGRFDEWGWFEPNPDVLATVDSGFTIVARLLHPSAQLSDQRHYDAEYSCIVSAGKPGAPGRAGTDGADGSSGGRGGSNERGGDGGDGQSGGPGGPGYDGPQLQVYASYVRTRRYPKLLAVRVRGDLNDFVLAPADRPFALIARGGQGGRGGAGGRGGDGGDGGSGASSNDGRDSAGGQGGDGGHGGSGGAGGVGGNGGRIELIYDKRYPELARLLLFDVDGGLPGEGGAAGGSGRAGSGGSGSAAGGSGNSGNYGVYGSAGRAGSAQASAGDVARYFRSVPGIELLPDPR